MMMSQLGQERNEHPTHCCQRIPHLWLRGFALHTRPKLHVAIGAAVAVGVLVRRLFLHSVHSDVSLSDC